MIPAVGYQKIDDDGLQSLDRRRTAVNWKWIVLVICADGNLRLRELADRYAPQVKRYILSADAMSVRDGAGCPTGDCPRAPDWRWKLATLPDGAALYLNFTCVITGFYGPV